MKKIILMTALLMAGCMGITFAGNHQNAQDEPQDGKVIQMTDSMFLTNIFDYLNQKQWKYAGKKPAVVDFYATWCGPCRMVAPIMKKFAKEYEGQITVYKVNVDKEKALAGAMGITSLPTVVFFPMEGTPQIIQGAADKKSFQRAVEQVLLGKPAE